MTDATTLFRKQFSQPPIHVVRAPGRLELLGNHTDYNDGLVLSLAVDKCIEFAVSPRTDGKIELVSSAFSERESFSVDQLQKNPAAPWADYVKGVLAQMRKRGVHFKGFTGAIHGTIPMGAGMSSSAALEVATALAVRQLYPYTLTDTGLATPPKPDARGKLPVLTPRDKLAIAKLCQAAESEFVGVRVGLLDQVSSLCGKAWHAMEIDFKFLTVELLPLPGEAIVVCDSGKKHELVGGEYNELRAHCEAAAKKLGVASLRAADSKMLEAGKAKLSEREYQCARHIVDEIQRVVVAGRALRNDDHAQFGQYMLQSHESSRDFLKNSTPELDALVDIARKHPACLGARLTGGGFGGATINLVRHHEAPGFMEHMAAEYPKRCGLKTQPILCQIVDGAA